MADGNEADDSSPDGQRAGGGRRDRASGGESRSLGAFIRAHRQRSNLSLRQLSASSDISNAYLSQIERDLHQPSLRVLKRVSDALGLPPELLLSRAGMLRQEPVPPDETSRRPHVGVEEAIAEDPALTDEEKQALITVYRSYLANKRTDRPNRS